jgi:hypothetical protein
LKTNKSSKLINPELWEQQLISIYLGSLYNAESICKKITSGISALRRVKPFIAERDTLISIYTMPSYVPTSIIVLKFGMYLGKYNLNDYKSSKTELLELFQV